MSQHSVRCVDLAADAVRCNESWALPIEEAAGDDNHKLFHGLRKFAIEMMDDAGLVDCNCQAICANSTEDHWCQDCAYVPEVNA